jgi:hypothetical protein
MRNTPKWFIPVAVVALIWNLLGCVAYLADVMLSPDDLAKMSAAEQAMYAARPAWAVSATAVAVWFGALGCLGLVLRKRWSFPVLLISLLGVIVQDVALFGLSGAGAAAGMTAFVLQGLVLVVAVCLVLMSRHGIKQGWIG